MIDILVPVLGRAHRVEPLLENIASATDVPYRLLFLCSADDEEELDAVCRSGAEHLVFNYPPAQGQYAKKLNEAYRVTENEWLYLGADDLRFRTGWASKAFTYVGANTCVVGTNDLCNSFVRQGLLATHSLIRRSYIAETGSSLDGPGIVYHEGYSHMFVDCELSVLARNRGVYQFARGAIVEHLHPITGKVASDETYELGSAYYTSDLELFNKRLASYPRDQLVRRFIATEKRLARR